MVHRQKKFLIMSSSNKISVYIYDDTILVKNQNGKEKKFPRCGITNIELFVLEMAKKGKLDDLV